VAETQSHPRLIRFGSFEADVQTGELRRDGLKLKFSGQPFQVLAILLERPGDMVTREELRKRLWPDTFVDVERNLNTAVNKIREALGDSAESPRFVETLPRRGYRFICPVEAFGDGIIALNGSPVPERQDGSEVAVTEPQLGIRNGNSDRVLASGNESRTEIRRRIRPRWIFLAAFASSVALICVLIALLKSTGQITGHYKLTHLASNFKCGCSALWSPDGSAIAYARDINGTEQLFVRYLNSPLEIQLTHEPRRVYTLGWLPDKSHILVFEPVNTSESDQYKLLSIATVGGDPEFIMPWTGTGAALSADGKVFAIFTEGDRTAYGVQTSDPIGSPLKWYSPDPFVTKSYLNSPGIKFMPGGNAIMLTYDDDNIRFHSWLLPYPAGKTPPQPSPLTLPKVAAYQWSWMPDRRHLVTAWNEEEGSPAHLWMWDTESQERIPLTTGVEGDLLPRVSPDGSKLVFAQFTRQIDLTELSVKDGSATTLITTGRQESMASWSSASGKLAWVSDRNTPSEIWVRELDGTQRPVVTDADFPAGSNKFFMNPSISPDGNRIIYEKPDSSGAPRLWISSLQGGVPVLLTNAQDSTSEWGGSWSPDGKRFVYTESKTGHAELMIVKTTGNAVPAQILDVGGSNQIPEWSPRGDWIVFQDSQGWQLISPDGKSTKSLGKIDTDFLAFSRNGMFLYGIRKGTLDPQNVVLFSLNPITLKVRDIRNLGAKFAPVSQLSPGIRFSLSPDGRSLVYSTFRGHSDLWLLDGLRQPNWLARLRDSLIR
jgi:Tol biopolymer transport system component/DNA-binding winged helix-turn-helix (wHTH) protein